MTSNNIENKNQADDPLLPANLAPILWTCLQKYQCYWPAFSDGTTITKILVDWFRCRDVLQVENGHPPEYVDWPTLFRAINRTIKAPKDDERCWSHDYVTWGAVLQKCERLADPAAYDARIKRQRDAHEAKERYRRDQEIAERKIDEAIRARKRAEAAERRARKERGHMVKRVMKVTGLSRWQARSFIKNGTENPDYQISLAREFTEMAGRNKPEDWAFEGHNRFDRSFKMFLLSQAAEFEDDIGPDVRRLREQLAGTPVNHIRPGRPGALAMLLRFTGGNPANARTILIAFDVWRNVRRAARHTNCEIEWP